MWYLLAVILAQPAPLLPKACDPADALSCVQPLRLGDVAPFDGQLLTPRRAAHLAVVASGCRDLVDLELSRERDLGALRLAAERAMRENDRTAAKLRETVLLKEIETREEPAVSWYSRPPVVVGCTVVAIVAILVASVQLIQAVK